jgi:hypothetical protein
VTVEQELLLRLLLCSALLCSSPPYLFRHFDRILALLVSCSSSGAIFRGGGRGWGWWWIGFIGTFLFDFASAADGMSLVGVGRYRTDRGEVGELGFSPASFFFCPLVYWLVPSWNGLFPGV